MDTPIKRSSQGRLSLDAAESPMPPSPAMHENSQFNFWEEMEERREVKKLKLEQEAGVQPKIRDIIKKVGLVKDAVKMRILSVKLTPMKSNENKQTLKFIGMDETGEIEAVAWTPTAERLADLLHVNTCVDMMNFTVKRVNPIYGSVTGLDYDITCSVNTTVSPTDGIPEIEFNTNNTVADIKANKKGEVVDILAVVCRNDGRIDGPYGAYRTVFLTDHTCGTIAVNLGGLDAIRFGDDTEVTGFFRKFKVVEKGDAVYLQTTSRSGVWRDPSNEHATKVLEDFVRRKQEMLEARRRRNSQETAAPEETLQDPSSENAASQNDSKESTD